MFRRKDRKGVKLCCASWLGWSTQNAVCWSVFDTNLLNDYWIGSMPYSQIGGNMVKSESIWMHSHSKSNGNAIWIDEKNNTISVWKQKRKECELWEDELFRILLFYFNARFHFKSDNNISCLHLPVNILLFNSLFVSWKMRVSLHGERFFDIAYTCVSILYTVVRGYCCVCLCHLIGSRFSNYNPSNTGNDVLHIKI